MPLSLRQANRLRGAAGQRLPDAYPSFQRTQIQFRRGHLYLVAAAPGVGKSVLAMNLALRMQVPSQYFSMDTDAHTTCVRTVQHVALLDGVTAEAQVQSEGLLAKQALDAVSWIKYDFPSQPDTDELARRVWAYAEAEGDWPHLVIVDNLMDVAFDEEENRGLNRIMDDLAKLARYTRAATLVLHHVTGEYEDGDRSIRLSGLRQKVGKKPAMVLTLDNGGFETQLVVTIAKNRFGPKGKVTLHADFAHMQIRDNTDVVARDRRDGAHLTVV